MFKVLDSNGRAKIISPSTPITSNSAQPIFFPDEGDEPFQFPPGLSDVSFGTWTPVDTSGAGLAIVVTGAEYFKISRLVIASCIITYPTTVDATPSQLGGLPFTYTSPANIWGGSIAFNNSGLNLTVLPLFGGTNFKLNGLSGAAPTNASISGKVFIFTLFYRTG